ncbi:hypothetical protein ANME2D_01248 [Candidatus Methanoperedens nitroreducens]|uniref:PGF-pre-PGF domain-containing protein n=1 Tax=Candidatus Methanoperedens nitratireducens TaxID=1392998 RepID=A0A062V8B2_9EURY|nr:PGF-pre-PGF domain-containing protein [Candidatus Methanoperedens nitroreducens]KCZ72813.1 hypothetical protein ANME2D_01248 [Candidatus Methanoperedens nitroreducens]MDJ1423257.1 PGF-pre-PGF domain-containing protein [Candidatus Methanoperedens sp.]
MRILLRVLMVVIIFGLLVGSVSGTTITFDKSLDVPDRTFTWEGKVYEITDIGLYEIGQNIGITINSPGVSNKLVTLYLKNKDYPSPISVWSKTLYGESSTVIPYYEISAEVQGISGTFGLLVTNKDIDKIGEILAAKPIVISEYKLLVTPESSEKVAGSVINVTVKITKDGVPYNVGVNTVKVEFVPLSGSLSPIFGGDASPTSINGTYTANIIIPPNVAGTYMLYAAITTDYKIYGDYPEIIGAVSYSGDISIQTSSAGGGSGGGGGGDQSGEEFKNIESKESYEKFISKDVPVTYTFKQSGNPINEVVITGNINAGDIAVKIEVLRGTSSLVGSSPPGLVYKNINILVGTSGFAVPKNIKEAIVRFSVENSWLESNNLAGSDINMVRWDGSKWIQLATTETTKDSTHTYYEVETDTFSAFAITGLKGGAVPASAGTEPETTRTPTAATPTETQTPAATEKGIPGFETATTVFAIALAVALQINRERR